MIYVFRSVITLIAIVFLLAIIIFIHHAVKGKPAKLLFGLAEINTLKTDTIYKLTQQKKDTVYQETVRYISNGYVKNTMSEKPLKKDSVSKNQTNSSGPNAHIINGNGNQVGINGDQYNGIKQRHLNEAVLSYLLVSLPDKHAEIQFLFAGGKEGLNYANEIYNALMQRGYSNIKPSNWMDPTGFDKVEVKKENGSLQLLIYPASNVQEN
jgi:hypothetical protein